MRAKGEGKADEEVDATGCGGFVSRDTMIDTAGVSLGL